jgi:hypothetical protein
MGEPYESLRLPNTSLQLTRLAGLKRAACLARRGARQ